MASELDRRSINSLEHLQKLEENALIVSELEESSHRRKKELETLKQQLIEKKKEKYEVTAKLESNAYRILKQVLQDEPNGRKSLRKKRLSRHELVVLKDAVSKARQMKAAEIKASYRLTGATVEPIKNTKLRICWDTFHRGEFFESFYAEVDIQEQSKIEKHSIPYFIPLQPVVERHLSKDMQSFVQTVGNYLNAYVSRRQEAVEMERVHKSKMVGEVHTASAFDFLQFYIKLRDDDCILEVCITYTDLQDRRPSKFVLRVSGIVEDSAGLREQLLELKTDLKSLSLTDAFNNFFRDDNRRGK